MFVVYAMEEGSTLGQKMASFVDEDDAYQWGDEQNFHCSFCVLDTETGLVDFGEGWEEWEEIG